MVFLRYIVLTIFGIGTVCVQAEIGEFKAGLKFQKTYNLYYENGLELGYTHTKLWDRRVQFQVSYVSSRLGSALSSNALKQDYYLFSTGLHFRPVKLIEPYIQLNLGYFQFDTEIDKFTFLPNTTLLYSFATGVKFNVLPKIGGFYLDLGYNFVQGNGKEGPGTLYPLFFNLGLLFNIFPGVIR